jgi:hypothetical protein
MKRTIISESEKKQILEQHNTFKKVLNSKLEEKLKSSEKVISEQSAPIFAGNLTISDVIRKCVTGPNIKAEPIFFRKTQPAIKVIGGPDNVRIYTNEVNSTFGGYNWYVLNTAENKILKGPFSWNCKALTASSPEQSQDIQRLKSEYGWKEKSEINATSDDLATLYEKHPKYNLYRLKSQSQITGGLTPEQNAFIKQYTDKGGILTLTPEQRASGNYIPQTVSKAGENGFTQDMIIYFPPNDLKNVKNTTATTDQLIPVDDCKKIIEAYYSAYINQTRVPRGEFEGNKLKAQACVNQHYGQWGGLFSGGNKLDNYINKLTGQIAGGPGSYGTGSEYRLTPSLDKRRKVR